ncbi:GDSL esterase/lipase [Sesamum angolense]|uniref:GDSL esterase/lipase n=1 Tax=Sesamum angolense TaxID=2727404 RepID=A0AAE2BVB9_9LAMI|nr:GDSL esterase/lipase [Sesamum angolense]
MRPKIYLFGDSITEESFSPGGWGSSLSHHFARTADVMLRGYSGYNTRWALKVKERVFPAAESGDAPVAVTVFFGANDAAVPDRCSGFQHVPLDEYKQNLHDIVAFLKRTGNLRSDGSSQPYSKDPYINNLSGLPERTNESAGRYAKQCLAAAAECGVPVIDLWTKMQQSPGWQKAYLRDGLHLTGDGNKVVFEEVIGQLQEGGISLETLPADLPLWAEIDPNDPLKCFEK